MKQSLATLAEKLDCRLIGDGSITVERLSSLKSANAASLVFVDDAKHFEAALASAAGAVIAGCFAEQSKAIAELTADLAAGLTTKTRKTILISSQPRLAFARAARLLRDDVSRGRGIHPSAIVGASLVGSNVDIGPRAVIGEQASIGDSSTIGAGCVIGEGVEIGAACRIDANVTIYSGTTLGNRVVVQAGAVLGSEASATCATSGPDAMNSFRKSDDSSSKMTSRLERIPPSTAARSTKREFAAAQRSITWFTSATTFRSAKMW